MVDQTPAPSSIRDTSKDYRDPAERLGLGLGMGGSDALTQIVTAQEAAGQRQLVNSDRLPVKGSQDPEFVALGFSFGEPDRHDPLFRPATLPSGWSRQGSDHAMWSYIVDDLGRKRVGIFYKAAFYDRDAFMHLETPTAYLRSVLYDNARPVLDDVWLTSTVAVEVLGAIATERDGQAVEADGLAAGGNDDYWTARAAEHRAEAAKTRALAESLS